MVGADTLPVLQRAWNDLDDVPVPEHLQRDPSMRPLSCGEVDLMDLNITRRCVVVSLSLANICSCTVD